MIRLIAMDMDGTLLEDPRKGLPPRNAEALRRAQAQGVALAICSGRTTEDASYFASDAGLEMHILGLNGGYCLDRPHGKCMANHVINAATVQALLAMLNALPKLEYGVFSGEDIVLNYTRTPEQMKLPIWGTYLGRSGKTFLNDGGVGLELVLDRGVNKLVVIDKAGTGVLPPLRQRIAAELPELEVSSSWVDNIEIMPRGVNKGTAVTELAQQLGVPLAEVMTLGDNDNDIPMLTCAGYGVAMENATPGASAAAKYHTARYDAYGVAEAIEKYVLKA